MAQDDEFFDALAQRGRARTEQDAALLRVARGLSAPELDPEQAAEAEPATEAFLEQLARSQASAERRGAGRGLWMGGAGAALALAAALFVVMPSTPEFPPYRGRVHATVATTRGESQPSAGLGPLPPGAMLTLELVPEVPLEGAVHGQVLRRTAAGVEAVEVGVQVSNRGVLRVRAAVSTLLSGADQGAVFLVASRSARFDGRVLAEQPATGEAFEHPSGVGVGVELRLRR